MRGFPKLLNKLLHPTPAHNRAGLLICCVIDLYRKTRVCSFIFYIVISSKCLIYLSQGRYFLFLHWLLIPSFQVCCYFSCHCFLMGGRGDPLLVSFSPWKRLSFWAGSWGDPEEIFSEHPPSLWSLLQCDDKNGFEVCLWCIIASMVTFNKVR